MAELQDVSDLGEKILARYKRHIEEHRKGYFSAKIEKALRQKILKALKNYPAEYVEFTDAQSGLKWRRMMMSHVDQRTPDTNAVVYDFCEDGRMRTTRLASNPIDSKTIISRATRDDILSGGENAEKMHIPDLLKDVQIGDSWDVVRDMADMIVSGKQFGEWYRGERRKWQRAMAQSATFPPIIKDPGRPRPDKAWREQAVDELAHIMHPFVHAHRRQVQFAVLQNVPKGFFRAMVRARTRDGAAYDWLAANGDKTIQDYRLMAISSMPGMASWLIDGFDDGEITAAIDNHEKLIPLLKEMMSSEEIKVSRPVLRLWLQPKRLQEMPDKMNSNPDSTLRLLQSIPESEYPHTAEDWRKIDRLYYDVGNLSSGLNMSRAEVMAQLAQDKGQLIKVLRQNPDHNIAKDIADWRRRVTQALLIPQVYLTLVDMGLVDNLEDARKSIRLSSVESIGMRAVSTICGDASILEQLRTSKNWHKLAANFEAKLATLGLEQLPGEPEWIALTEPVTMPNGVTITPLTTPRRLRLQGEEQKHCVGGYAGQCLKNVHVFDFRDESGAVSTGHVMEQIISDQDGQVAGRKIVFKDLRGRGNKDPKGSHRQAFDSYIQAVNKREKYKPDWDLIDDTRKHLTERLGEYGVVLQIGYNPVRPDAGPETYKIASPFMATEKLRAMSYEEWLEQANVRGCIECIILDDDSLLESFGLRPASNAHSLRVGPHRPEVENALLHMRVGG